MAFQQTYTDKFGLTHTEAYYRIVAVSIQVESNLVTVVLNVYPNQTLRLDGKPEIGTIVSTFTVDQTKSIFKNSNHFTEGLYNFLKTLPEFQGAIDV